MYRLLKVIEQYSDLASDYYEEDCPSFFKYLLSQGHDFENEDNKLAALEFLNDNGWGIGDEESDKFWELN